MEPENLKNCTKEEKKEIYRDFIRFIDGRIRSVEKTVDFLRHATIATVLGCILSILIMTGISSTVFFLSISTVSFVLLMWNVKRLHYLIIVRESTYEEMVEL
jgi:hypothetical protein